jgi:O-antigen ligase
MGAAGNAPVFATLAFAGMVVALHESTRRGRWYAGPLAAVDFALVVLSATRMAVLASAIFAVAYGILSPGLRARLRAHWGIAALGLALAGGALLLYWPTLEARMFTGESGAISLSGRDDLWSFYYREFLLSPIAGRGLGAGFIAASDWRPGLSTPHNEYLHLLVVGGVAGALLIVAGVAAWYRGLLLTASPNDRACLVALIPALAVYAVTDNLSFYTSALALYAYLGILLTRPTFSGGPAILPSDHLANSTQGGLPGLAGGAIRDLTVRR